MTCPELGSTSIHYTYARRERNRNSNIHYVRVHAWPRAAIQLATSLALWNKSCRSHRRTTTREGLGVCCLFIADHMLNLTMFHKLLGS
ncbi:hypothetical protein CONPUDRAFT_138038 [Coniophora puteana RWD-64-598 SS2]|uniref:Uncharacterized protein n=1 Tax=Coniophora puteana (strain RWD-64-598) TaxID=741705 RepID=A0A5M3MML8_CONPW|nr:uncharacterized protein CONPUDRAFT_138038 [Coniophora puteana RWD-64-598 SS2]EIW79841.1 hypothetical protein CONPUDRAFT_138038 [Coniophora puteana RWD-64-598 SS2]